MVAPDIISPDRLHALDEALTALGSRTATLNEIVSLPPMSIQKVDPAATLLTSRRDIWMDPRRRERTLECEEGHDFG